MEFDRKNIRGMYTEVGTICRDCLGDEELKSMDEGSVILDGDADDPDNRMTCDECGQRL
jgi:hypothetical protein